MHWLLLLAVLSTSTILKDGGSATSMNRLAENALRQRLGGASNVRVQVTPGKNKVRGDFDAFNISLDGFAVDRLMGLADRAEQSYGRGGNNSGEDGRYPFSSTPGSSSAAQRRNLEAGDLGDLGEIFGGDLGGIFGEVLGGKTGGRIGRIRLRATNFTFQGARYDTLDATLGEVRFDWVKALCGDFDIKSIQPGSLGLNLRADQAARLLAPRLPSISDLRVRFANGLAYIGGRSEFYGVGVPFEVGGRLSVQQNQVRADDIRASVSKLRLPAILVSELTRGINPICNFDPKGRWPLAINLQTAGTNNNALGLRGGIEWRGFNRSDRDENRNENRNRSGRDRSGDYNDDNEGYRGRNDRTGEDYPAESRDSGSSAEDILGDIFGR